MLFGEIYSVDEKLYVHVVWVCVPVCAFPHTNYIKTTKTYGIFVKV